MPSSRQKIWYEQEPYRTVYYKSDGISPMGLTYDIPKIVEEAERRGAKAERQKFWDQIARMRKGPQMEVIDENGAAVTLNALTEAGYDIAIRDVLDALSVNALATEEWEKVKPLIVKEKITIDPSGIGPGKVDIWNPDITPNACPTDGSCEACQ